MAKSNHTDYRKSKVKSMESNPNRGKGDVRKHNLTPDKRMGRTAAERKAESREAGRAAGRKLAGAGRSREMERAKHNVEINRRGRAARRRMTETPMKSGNRRPRSKGK